MSINPQLINNGARALSGGSAEDLFKAASNAAAVAKANAEQKRIEEESRKAIEKLEQQLTNHLTEERNKLIEKHRDQLNELKGTYYFEPDLEWERYLMKAEKYHEDEIRNIERNFSTKNASWAEPKNSPPSEPYNSANRTYSSSQYVRIAQHKYSMYEQYNKNEFLTASSEFTNKALLVDKGNVDAIKYKVAHFSGNSLEGLILYDYAITQQPHDEELANQRQAQYQKFIPDFFNAIQTDNQSFVSEACKYNYQANLKNSDGDVPIMYAIKNDKAGMFETLRRIQFTDSAFVAQQSSLLRMCIIENASKTIHTLILDGASPNTIFRFAKDSTDTVGFEMTALNFSAFKTKKMPLKPCSNTVLISKRVF